MGHAATSRVLHSSVPIIPVDAPMLNRFRDMVGAHAFRAVQIGDGARHFQDAVVRARRKAHAPHRHFERALTGGLQRHSHVVSSESPQRTLLNVQVQSGSIKSRL